MRASVVGAMATTQCPHCRLVLTIPPDGLGRRLKCPSCLGKFYATSASAEARPPSGGGKGSSILEARPASASWPRPEDKRAPGDVPLGAPGSLRETFDLPLLGSIDQRGDAAALFRDDDEPPRRRRGGGPEGRSHSRTCADCGSLVPAGLSLCGHCGLDQDTGQRVSPSDDLMPEDDIVYATARTAPPGLQIVGIAGLLAAGAVAVLAIAAISGGAGPLAVLGAAVLAALGLFLAFASAKLLQGRSHRPMLAALALTALLNVAGLIILPVVNAGNMPTAHGPTESDFLKGIDANPGATPGPTIETLGPPDAEEVLPSYEVDTKSLAMGLVILMIEGVVFAYLMSEPVRDYFEAA